MEPHVFRVLLLRRLHLPLHRTLHSCRCPLPLYSRGHHRAACDRVGVLRRRGYALESVAARICREAGGRVSTNVMVRDLDLVQFAGDARRFQVVADGFPLWARVRREGFLMRKRVEQALRLRWGSLLVHSCPSGCHVFA